MGNLNKPDRILFLLEPKSRRPLVLTGVDRKDAGTSVTCASSMVYFYDSEGSYLPCSAGGYHVHRGTSAEAEYKRCNCAHDTLIWIAKQHNAMMCSECHRTFVIEDRPKDDEEVVCVLEEAGDIRIYTPKDGTDWDADLTVN